MKILLDEQESQKWLHLLEYPKERYMGNVLPEQKPNGMIKARPSAHTKEIMELSDGGLFPKEIAGRLGLGYEAVKSLIYRERKKVKQPSQFAPNFTGSKIKAELAKVESCQAQAETATLLTTTNLDPIIPTRQEAIDHIINMGVDRGHKYTTIAAKIGREVGGAYTADHVAARIRELRGDKQ